MTINNFSPKHWAKLLLRPKYREYVQKEKELRRLKRIPRYTLTSTNILGTEIKLVDSASFIFMYKEVFREEIYKFVSKSNSPLIIDCGANIGLSVIYFKMYYPNSKIIAFEPDKKVLEVLRNNIKCFNLSDVELISKALWSSEKTLEFMSEGADGGRVNQLEKGRESYNVQTTRLRYYLNQKVDLLKLDIEGAETEVIKDCKDLLFNVENLFVEYHSFVNEIQTLSDLIKILDEVGFRLHIHPPFTSPQPFYHRRVHFGMDMQLNIFAFRELN
jgi:FkbM family methyltransferase